jgi:hypothetical protein
MAQDREEFAMMTANLNWEGTRRGGGGGLKHRDKFIFTLHHTDSTKMPLFRNYEV